MKSLVWLCSLACLCVAQSAWAQTKPITQPVSAGEVQLVASRSPARLPEAWSDRPIVLQVKPVLQQGRLRAFDFSYSFDAPHATELVLRLPDNWGGETALHTQWQDLRAENAQLLAGDGPAQRRLRFEPGARVTLRYRVVDAAGAPRTKRGNDYRPQIAATHFQLVGHTVVPHLGAYSGSPARFERVDWPAELSFASDLEHPNLKLADLSASILVGGDFRVLQVGEGVRLAIRGHWSRTDAQWAHSLSRIAKAQRSMWRSASAPFLVTVKDLPPVPGGHSMGGTGLGDSFAFFATPNAPDAEIDRILAHEMMHSWLPAKVGGMPVQDEAKDYWLSEGFTDWASWRSMVAAGLWRPEDYARAFNDKVAEHDASEVANAPNSEVATGFWRNFAMQSLPYSRGMIFAHWLDERLLSHTQRRVDLHAILLHMQATAQAWPHRDVAPTARQLLLQATRQLAGLDIEPDLQRHIEQGLPVALAPDSLAPCGTLTSQRRLQLHSRSTEDARSACTRRLGG